MVLQLARHARNTTGVLASHEMSRDVKITSFSLTFHGMVLFEDTTLELNYGRRYGKGLSKRFCLFYPRDR